MAEQCTLPQLSVILQRTILAFLKMQKLAFGQKCMFVEKGQYKAMIPSSKPPHHTPGQSK